MESIKCYVTFNIRIMRDFKHNGNPIKISSFTSVNRIVNCKIDHTFKIKVSASFSADIKMFNGNSMRTRNHFH